MKAVTLFLALICATLVFAAQTPTCGAIKKNGQPCRQPVKHQGERCYYHDSTIVVPRCGAIKKDGQPCRMKVNKAGDRCYFHPSKAA